jgi:low affinity Fe/Cu permease
VSVKHPVERGDEGRSLFDSAAERASNLSSSPAFFAMCVLLVVAWMLSYGLGWSDHARFFLGDAIGAITLLLVALLKNAEVRAEAAVQEKLDAIALALLEVRRGTADGAADELERAIGRHEEV